MFTSDNFNKYPEVDGAARGDDRRAASACPSSSQCDAQIERQPRSSWSCWRGPVASRCSSGVESFSPRGPAGRPQVPEPPGPLRRDRAPLPRAPHQQPLLEHPRLPDGHRGLDPRAPGDAARAVARRGLVLHPHAHPGHRAVRRLPRAGLDHRAKPRPLRRSLRRPWRHPRLDPASAGAICSSVLPGLLRTGRVGAEDGRRLRGEAVGLPDGQTLFAIAGARPAGAPRRADHAHAPDVGRDREGPPRPCRRGTCRRRRDLFGCELVPLPRNLELSRPDQEINRRAKLPRRSGSIDRQRLGEPGYARRADSGCCYAPMPKGRFQRPAKAISSSGLRLRGASSRSRSFGRESPGRRGGRRRSSPSGWNPSWMPKSSAGALDVEARHEVHGEVRARWPEGRGSRRRARRRAAPCRLGEPSFGPALRRRPRGSGRARFAPRRCPGTRQPRAYLERLRVLLVED